MSIINNKKSVTAALGAAAAAVAAPALLFVGAGTAHANGGVVTNTADLFGTTVTVQTDGKTFGNCTYSAVPIIGPGVPSGVRPFAIDPKFPVADLWFPGVKLNTTWDVTVSCDHGGSFKSKTVY